MTKRRRDDATPAAPDALPEPTPPAPPDNTSRSRRASDPKPPKAAPPPPDSLDPPPQAVEISRKRKRQQPEAAEPPLAALDAATLARIAKKAGRRHRSPNKRPRPAPPDGVDPAVNKVRTATTRKRKPKQKPRNAARRPEQRDNHNPNRYPNPAGVGRPIYVPSDHDIAQVEALAGALGIDGFTHKKIAMILGINESTYGAHMDVFSPAAERGMAMAEATVGDALLRRANTGSLGHVEYWENTRPGRLRRTVVRHEGSNGEPLPDPAELASHTTQVIHNGPVIGIYLPDNGRGPIPGEPLPPPPETKEQRQIRELTEQLAALRKLLPVAVQEGALVE